jgi:hypothetical protein
VTGLSADGLTIVGYGTNPAGQPEGWLAYVPEPGSLPIAGIAAALLAGARRRDVCEVSSALDRLFH